MVTVNFNELQASLSILSAESYLNLNEMDVRLLANTGVKNGQPLTPDTIIRPLFHLQTQRTKTLEKDWEMGSASDSDNEKDIPQRKSTEPVNNIPVLLSAPSGFVKPSESFINTHMHSSVDRNVVTKYISGTVDEDDVDFDFLQKKPTSKNVVQTNPNGQKIQSDGIHHSNIQKQNASILSDNSKDWELDNLLSSSLPTPQHPPRRKPVKISTSEEDDLKWLDEL